VKGFLVSTGTVILPHAVYMYKDEEIKATAINVTIKLT